MEANTFLFISVFCFCAAGALLLTRRSIARRYAEINRLNRRENLACDDDRTGREGL